MKRNEPISKIMQKEVITVHKGQMLSEVRALFTEHKIHHLPVVDGNKVIGIISATDIFQVSFGQSDKEIDSTLDHTTSLEEVMNKSPQTISSHDTIRAAAEVLSGGTFHSLPVVDDGVLVGMVTSTDLIRYLLDQY